MGKSVMVISCRTGIDPTSKDDQSRKFKERNGNLVVNIWKEYNFINLNS